MLVCWESPKKPPTLFFQPVQPPCYSNPPIINNYYNVQPPYYSNPSYYSGLESTNVSSKITGRQNIKRFNAKSNFLKPKALFTI